MISLDEIALTGASGRYTRTLDARWVYGEEIFSGYTAALALAAARNTSPHPHPVSAHVTHLGPVRPGPLRLEVSVLRPGRRTWFGHVTGTQHGREVVSCTAWFGERGMPSSSTPRPRINRPLAPTLCPDISWVQFTSPDARFLETRAIGEAEAATDIPARAHLWVRPADPMSRDPFLAQAFDLMLADPRVLRSMQRSPRTDAYPSAHQEVTISWEPPALGPRWRRVSGAVRHHPNSTVTWTGEIHAEDGTLRASIQTNSPVTRTAPNSRSSHLPQASTVG